MLIRDENVVSVMKVSYMNAQFVSKRRDFKKLFGDRKWTYTYKIWLSWAVTVKYRIFWNASGMR
jgi:hypothetical protein